eukprot:TRINITY_DN16730_c0_g2_i1.p1 TRINITY_DN16730_c0_g2~~TRINITY_DN16730_c0_g2_i1.p1  ORF type:complete len:369 (+),score=127.01 TRINITY_DN16730_c0_g2_i1:72-1109(+)
MKLQIALVVLVAMQAAVDAADPTKGTDNSGETNDEDTNAETQQLMAMGGGGQTLRTGGWSWDKCQTVACKHGEGDCDTDDECVAGLACGHNNCKAMHPMDAANYEELADCCEVMQPFHLDYCMKNPGCGFGIGDCDNDDQCGDGLVCGLNNCRAMHPEIDPVLLHHRADCCTTCAAVTAVKSGVAMPQPPMAFTNGKLTTAERTLANPPTALENAVVHSLPGLAAGDEIKLECCSKKKAPCNFFVAVYHCPPCSKGQNGGIPMYLANNDWQGSSCSPVFSPSGSNQAQTMTVFQKTFAPGEKLTIPLSANAPHTAVFTSSGPVGDWCPRKVAAGTTGPQRPCVCL